MPRLFKSRLATPSAPPLTGPQVFPNPRPPSGLGTRWNFWRPELVCLLGECCGCEQGVSTLSSPHHPSFLPCSRARTHAHDRFGAGVPRPSSSRAGVRRWLYSMFPGHSRRARLICYFSPSIYGPVDYVLLISKLSWSMILVEGSAELNACLVNQGVCNACPIFRVCRRPANAQRRCVHLQSLYQCAVQSV